MQNGQGVVPWGAGTGVLRNLRYQSMYVLSLSVSIFEITVTCLK